MGLKNYLLGNNVGVGSYWPALWNSYFLYKRYTNIYLFLETFFFNFFLNNSLNIYLNSLKKLGSTQLVYSVLNSSYLISKIWFLRFKNILFLVVQVVSKLIISSKSSAGLLTSSAQGSFSNYGLLQNIYKKNYKFYIMNIELFLSTNNLNMGVVSHSWLLFRHEQVNFNILTKYCMKLSIILKKQYTVHYLLMANILLTTLTNIYLLDILGTYRGWRHFSGLPVHGQRTWSNGKTSKVNNLLLRRYKGWRNSYNNKEKSKNDFSQNQVINLWRSQWGEIWKKKK